MEQSLSILVFDQDDPSTLRNTMEAIQEYQSVVLPCSSAEAILFVIKHRAVDAVILNLQKPFEQSFRLLAQIKANAPKVEVIFVSPFDEETQWLWIEAIQRGAYEFLPKPLDLIELKRMLLQATEKHHPVRFRKFPPAESVKDFTPKNWKSKASSRKN
jgi:DNA-binding NtrC family response regulator